MVEGVDNVNTSQPILAMNSEIRNGIIGVDEYASQPIHNHPCENDKRMLHQITIEPRSEKIVELSFIHSYDVVIRKKQIKPGVYLAASTVRPEKNKIKIMILNATENKVNFYPEDIDLEWDRLEEFDIIESNTKKDPVENRLNKLVSLLDLAHCNMEERESIVEICRNYNDLFYLEGDYLTFTNAITHKITTEKDKNPIYTKPYRLPESQKGEIHKQVREMIDNEIVRPSFSPWNSPLLLVPKKADSSGNKRWRVVVDFRKLNNITVGDAYPLPNITDILDQLGHSKYFSTLDLASGFHQILVDEEDREKTAFSTPFGHYEYNRMPFGLKNAPASFQRLMNNVLMGLQGIDCFVYVDDIVCYGSTLANHNQRLVKILDRLRLHNLKIQPDKCHFIKKELMYLGHVISEQGIRPDPEKIKVVKTYPIPKKAKDVKAFLGFAGYYRRFIENFAKVAKPLTKLLKKDADFVWDAHCDEAFKILKNNLITAPILAYPNFKEEFLITTDASNYAIGAILSQGKIGQDKPICYASRTLNSAESRYSTSEKELLAIVYAVKQFRPYIYGRHFTIITDHRPLQGIINLKDPTSRLARWKIFLEDYDYTIIYKPGRCNANADALSRIKANENENVVTNQVMVMTRNQKRALQENEEQTKQQEILSLPVETKK